MILESPVWRIKYLPQNLTEICGRTDIKERLKDFVKDNNFPHLLFVGSKGIGKTLIADMFSKEFLGRYYDANSKIVYANVPLTNEERKQARTEAYVSTSKIGSIAGKKITTPPFIRVKIKPFVQLKVLGDVPFKILLVKDFDTLGSNQQAFRRLMEIYGTNCRMVLITTRVSKIIDPIMSRCQVFFISQVDFHSFEELISTIAEKETLKIDIETIRTLYKITEGNLSNAIDLLQICSISGDDIDVNKLYENLSNSKNNMVKSLLIMCFKGDFRKARELSRKIQSSYKFSSQEMFHMMLTEVAKLPFSTYSRITLINFISEADFRAIDGRDTDIQISNLLAKICQFSEVL
ncbi:MAG: AAA family ATPase [Promethearchaeota archaeon]